MTAPVVKTMTGLVRGLDEARVHAFLGIPYAAAPTGPHRLRPPVPAPEWDGVRECVAYGATAPKNPYRAPFDRLVVEPTVAGEECLNLNIWTPELGGAKLPVLVWIHGGAFQNGSGAVPQYRGAAFARDGVVCVTINYRLGVDGFLFLDDGLANLGLLDQVAALNWVRDNIASFGGDPDRVTIAGQSAGAMSVISLLAMPRTRGLYRSAIAQSGAGHHATTADTAAMVGRTLAEMLGVPASRDAIAEVPLPTLLATQQQLVDTLRTNPDPAKWRELAGNLLPFEPVIDGDVLPALPVDALRAGASADVPVLIGTNTDEQRLFLVPNGWIDMIGAAVLDRFATAHGLSPENVQVYRAQEPQGTAGDVVTAISTDWFFRIPALRAAENHQGDTWVYEFAWTSPQRNGRLRACHALEIPFVFDTLGTEGAEWLTGSDAPQSLADSMHGAWVRFICDGDPGWPTYSAQQRSTMVFADVSQVIEDLRPSVRLLWEGRR